MAFDFFEKIGNQFGSPGSESSSLPRFILGLVVFLIIVAIFPATAKTALHLAILYAPIWLPLMLVILSWQVWITYRRAAFISSEKYVLLEIKPPHAHAKTPLSMEVALSGLHLGPGENTWYSKFVQGKVRPYWSLEIASIEGHVHFFIWTRESFRRIVETNVYAQYPGAQVTAVPDYTRLVSGTPDEWVTWGCDYTHTKPDPYPIKTYVDYGLDKKDKEWEQTDPLANLLEFMGSLGPGEQLWMQLIVRVHKGEKYHKKNVAGEPYTWKDEAKEIVQGIRAQTVGKVRYKDVFTGEMRETEGFPNPTKGESDTMAAIERNVSKLAFDVGIRSVYIAKTKAFKATTIAGMIGIFKQFSSEGFNGLRPTRWGMHFNDYPWEPFLEKRKIIAGRKLVDAFRRRSYFHAPYPTPPVIMSTEEIATIYHIPSATVQTPTLSRVQSATQTAPPNLPT